MHWIANKTRSFKRTIYNIPSVNIKSYILLIMLNSVCAIGEEWVSALVLICISTSCVATAIVCTVVDAVEYQGTVVSSLLQSCVCFLAAFFILMVKKINTGYGEVWTDDDAMITPTGVQEMQLTVTHKFVDDYPRHVTPPRDEPRQVTPPRDEMTPHRDETREHEYE